MLSRVTAHSRRSVPGSFERAAARDFRRQARKARLETPRTKTPAGSVGIGGTQCCIYSVESPGGFWILGRTPVRLYDPGAPDPILLRPGDRVRFRAADRGEYDRIAARAEARAYVPVIT